MFFNLSLIKRPIGALLLAMLLYSPVAVADLAVERKAQLIHMLRHDCGSCHGMTLKGGLGPPLLPRILAIKPPPFLAYTILNGRTGTPMPPWRGILTPEEVDWLVEQLHRGVGYGP